MEQWSRTRNPRWSKRGVEQVSKVTMPLTEFIVQMLKADRSALERADPEKLARKYAIDPNHAAGLLALHLNGRTA